MNIYVYVTVIVKEEVKLRRSQGTCEELEKARQGEVT